MSDTVGDLWKGKLKRYFLAEYDPGWYERQGLDVLSLSQLLVWAKEYEPQGLKAFIRALSQDLNKEGDSSRESIRRERLRGLSVDFFETLAPGLPPVSRSFEAFWSRPCSPVVEEARRAAQAWAMGGGPPLLLLSGHPGVGKTHLAIAAARYLAGLGRPVMFRQEAGLLGELQECIRAGTVEAALEEACTIPWLVLDDLGVGHPGPWGQAAMERIIDARWANAAWARTLVTTNLGRRQLAPRVASRLGDVRVARAIWIEAPDYRREPVGEEGLDA